MDGRIQNNSPLRVLTGVAEAGSTERHMIGMQEVEPETATPGRGVAKTVGLPECEVQLAYLDESDLDDWLPMDDAAEREWLALAGADDTAETAEPKPKSGALPSHDRDRDPDRIERNDDQESVGDRTPKSDESEPESKIDPLDFFE